MEVRQILGGRYRLEDRLGEGGMAVVWRAFDLVLGRSVAVKVLAGRYAADADFRVSILAEAQAAARVSHPHLASVYDYGESVDTSGQTVPYVVMELLNGPTLTERLAGGPLPARAGLRICAEIAGALAVVHAHGLVHRDIKPANVMLTPDGAKLVDFGVAAPAGAPDDAGPGGKIMGTPSYVAPERLLGGAVVAASDVYGLGLLLFRVLTGRLPWPPGKPTLSVRAEPAELPDVDGVPAGIGELYLRCVALNADDRPTARETAVALAAAVGIRPRLGEGDLEDPAPDDPVPVRPPAIGEQPVPAAAPSPSGADLTTSPSPGAAGRRVVPVVIAAVATATAAVLVLTYTGQASAPPPVGGAEPSPSLTRYPPGGTGASTAPLAQPGPGVPAPTVTGDHGTVPGSGGTAGPGGGPAPDPTVIATTQPPPPATTPPAASGRRTFTSTGGDVAAVCSGSQAYLEAWSPALGYTARQIRRGPATTVGITFRKQLFEDIITVWCVAGEPEGDVVSHPGSQALSHRPPRRGGR